MSAITPGDREVARCLAEEIQQAEANGQRRSWRKVSTLVNQFGGTRLTGVLRTRMAAAIAESGLEVEPPLADSNVTRADSVRLLTRGRPDSPQPHVQLQASADASRVPEDTSTVTYSVWAPGHKANTSGPIQDAGATVMLLQVNPNVEPADQVLRVMQPYCHGLLTLEMVENLLTADHHPELDATKAQVRRLSTIAARVPEENHAPAENDATADAESLAGTLEFAPVEYLIGEDWLIICWHNFSDAESDKSSTGIGTIREEVMESVQDQWIASGARTAGDSPPW